MKKQSIEKIKNILDNSGTKALPRFHVSRYRVNIVWLCVALLFVLLIGRAFYQQVVNRDFLQGLARKAQIGEERPQALRGMLLDRNGTPLAISSPVMTVSIDPKFYFEQKKIHDDALAELKKNPNSKDARNVLRNNRNRTFDLKLVADILKLDYLTMYRKVIERGLRSGQYLVLKAEVSPQDVDKIDALRIYGVKAETKYKRYYPQPQPNSQIIGMVSPDGSGIEGLEKQLDDRLKGENGQIRFIRDKQGNRLDTTVVKEEKPGENINLSLDARLQYLMYRELAKVGVKYQANHASALAIDVKTGEILAMNTWPSYNPNDKNGRSNASVKRNRGAVDQFEPGSTMKPFSVAMGLASNKYKPNTIIDTSPGTMQLGNSVIRDAKNYGHLSLTNVIAKSSNVGVAKIALGEKLSALPQFYQKFGFGKPTAVELIGERSGNIQSSKNWTKPTIGTMAYGYGLDVTMLQLAQAYATLANKGKHAPLTIFKRDELPESKQVISEKVAEQVVLMMEKATQPGGTATAGAISGYRVAGKTGTARKLKTDGSGYATDDHRAVFAGVAPVSDPRLAIVIVVDSPKGAYYGGVIAAPVFSKIMQESLRLLNVPLDKAVTDISE